MITEVPEIKDVSLYEAIMRQNGEGFDICDNVWDWGIYIGCPKSFEEAGDDWYDKCMLLFCLNIRCKKVQPKWYSICLVSQFIKENIEVFRTFFNERNREGFRPSDYKHADDDTEDAGFFEAYMEPMESLIAGNYSESDYKDLYLLLGGK